MDVFFVWLPAMELYIHLCSETTSELVLCFVRLLFPFSSTYRSKNLVYCEISCSHSTRSSQQSISDLVPGQTTSANHIPPKVRKRPLFQFIGIGKRLEVNTEEQSGRLSSVIGDDGGKLAMDGVSSGSQSDASLVVLGAQVNSAMRVGRVQN